MIALSSALALLGCDCGTWYYVLYNSCEVFKAAFFLGKELFQKRRTTYSRSKTRHLAYFKLFCGGKEMRRELKLMLTSFVFRGRHSGRPWRRISDGWRSAAACGLGSGSTRWGQGIRVVLAAAHAWSRVLPTLNHRSVHCMYSSTEWYAASVPILSVRRICSPTTGPGIAPIAVVKWNIGRYEDLPLSNGTFEIESFRALCRSSPLRMAYHRNLSEGLVARHQLWSEWADATWLMKYAGGFECNFSSWSARGFGIESGRKFGLEEKCSCSETAAAVVEPPTYATERRRCPVAQRGLLNATGMQQEPRTAIIYEDA